MVKLCTNTLEYYEEQNVSRKQQQQIGCRCFSTGFRIESHFDYTLETCAFRSLFSTSRFRFSPNAVVKDASLEFSKASRSLSLCEAPPRSDSFLVFL